MLTKAAQFLLKNNTNAAFVALLFALFPFVNLPLGGFFAALIVGLVTLQKGAKDGFVILLWVALPVTALLLLKRIGLFDMLFLRCVLVWLFAIVLSKKHGWVPVLALSLLLGFIAVMVLHFVLGDPSAWWLHKFQGYLNVAQQAGELQVTQQEINHAMGLLAPVASGLVVLGVSFSTLFVLIFARAWQSHVYFPGTFKQEITHIRLGYIALGLIALNVVGAALGSKMLLDFLPVLSFPFFVAGLSLLHCLAGRRKLFLGLLFLSYAMLVFLPFFALVVWFVAAVADCCFDVRARELVKDEK